MPFQWAFMASGIRKMKKGDPKAKEAMRKHEEETDEIKKRARSVGYFWY